MRKLKVLVVDDVAADMEHAAALLRQQGHTVLMAQNGEEGVRVATNEHPDLILMDVVMPVVNGFQATRLLSRSAATCDIPVIVVSCKDQETDKLWAIKQGAKAYLTKQLNKTALLQTINTIMA